MKVLVCFLALLAGAFGIFHQQPGLSERILGGDETYDAEFPAVVSVQFGIRGNYQHACGGTTITRSWGLTAAHCFTDVPSQGSFRVVAGVKNLDDESSNRQTIRISHAFIPANYAGGAGPNDIAVYKLLTPLVLTDHVQTARIATPGPTPVGVANLVGWGAIGGTITPIMPNSLQSARVPIITFDECSETLTGLVGTHPLDQTSNICTGPLTGQISVCTGDSGDPIFQDNTIIGLITWGINPCGTPRAPAAIATRTSSFRSWVASMIDETLPN